MPEQIAPHEGRELDLVMLGTKPLGSCKAGSPLATVILGSTDLYSFVREGNIYFALTQAPINMYKLLNSSTAALVVRSKQEHNRLVGRLFGYTEEEIDVFIESNLDCACGDCTGGF
jgi:hypothetical protein